MSHFFSFSSKNNEALYSPKKIAKNSFIFTLQKQKRNFFLLLYKLVKYFKREIFVSEEVHQKIIKALSLPKDVEVDKMGDYYQKEYIKYRHIFSRIPKKTQVFTKPYYSLNYYKKLKYSGEKLDAAIKFFKSIKEE